MLLWMNIGMAFGMILLFTRLFSDWGIYQCEHPLNFWLLINYILQSTSFFSLTLCDGPPDSLMYRIRLYTFFGSIFTLCFWTLIGTFWWRGSSDGCIQNEDAKNGFLVQLYWDGIISIFITYITIRIAYQAYRIYELNRNIQRLAEGNSLLRSTAIMRIITESGIDPDTVPLSQTEIQLLKKEKMDAETNNGEQNECSICLEKMENRTVVHIPGCRHPFHADCIIHWLLKRPTCPLCKWNVRNALMENEIELPERTQIQT